MKKTKVSVIVPVCNNEHGIKECLDSVFNQSYRNYEVIVVDDCSADDTFGAAERFPCRMIRLDKNQGAAVARNKGAEAARGSILVFLDSDCVARKGWLSAIMSALEDKKIHAVASQYCRNLEHTFISEFAFMELLHRENSFLKYPKTAPTASFACRREAFERIGGFPSGYPRNFTSEDLVFSYSFGKRFRILWEPKAAVSHRFRKTLRSYLKQQFNSSRSDASLFIQKPKIVLADTFEDKKNYLEVMLSGILILSLIAGFFAIRLLLAGAFSLAAIIAINAGFFRFLVRKKRIRFTFYSIPTVLLRDLTWLFGGLAGMISASRLK